MYAEWPVRHPKGTYRIRILRGGGAMRFHMANLATGKRYETTSIWDMVRDIEDDLSANKFPHSAMQYRSWGAAAPAAPAPKNPKVVNIGNTHAEELVSEPGSPTFIVRILYRQNATWQGTVQWMEGGQTRQYRSLNELMKLMDEAVGLTA